MPLCFVETVLGMKLSVETQSEKQHARLPLTVVTTFFYPEYHLCPLEGTRASHKQHLELTDIDVMAQRIGLTGETQGIIQGTFTFSIDVGWNKAHLRNLSGMFFTGLNSLLMLMLEDETSTSSNILSGSQPYTRLFHNGKMFGL